jgi:plasmid stabilization system protein ParE
MPLAVKIALRAAREVREAADWWHTNRPAAPGAIGKDFGEAVSLLAEQPGIGAKHSGTRVKSLRRLYLSRVRYFIYYVADESTLKVLAFWHASRERPPRL